MTTDTIKALRDALTEARQFIDQGASEQGYGYARPANPHHFSPDAECCMPEEIKAHKAACEAFDKGEYTPERGSEWIGKTHILRAPWGIGGYTFRDSDAEQVIAKIDAALTADASPSPFEARTLPNGEWSPVTQDEYDRLLTHPRYECRTILADASEDAPRVADRAPGKVMMSAHALCPTEGAHPDRMRWMAEYFLKHYPAAARPAPVAATPAPAELLSIGATMANVMYNLAQKQGYVLSDADCAMYSELRQKWDAARRDTATAAPIAEVTKGLFCTCVTCALCKELNTHAASHAKPEPVAHAKPGFICQACTEAAHVAMGDDELLSNFVVVHEVAPAKMAEGASLAEVIAFLNGEATLDGVWFGNPPMGWRAYWWRKHLMAAWRGQQAGAVQKQQKTAGVAENGRSDTRRQAGAVDGEAG